MSRIRVRLHVVGVAFVTLTLAGSPLASARPAPARPAPAQPAPAQPATVEEARLDSAVPQEILRRSGFDAVAPEFTRALADVRSYRQAERAVVRQGSRLWDRAVDRAQGRGPARGDLSRDDDRPLYWARLGMTRELRQWQPEFGLPDAQRAKLLDRLERSSRGQDSMNLPAGKGFKRIVMTGFDPFTLDRDIRISNPSGATALALDGTWIRTGEGFARIETAVFPVRWQDFADGTVERTLRPQLPKADLFTTVSQGRVGRFDIERTNGAWRGGSLDNENLSRLETVPVGDPVSQPQWTTTTLPHAAIVAAGTGHFPVFDNTSVTEIPAGGTAPVVRPDGPTPGSTARAGGGGNYLSNEIAYRATLLRDRLGLTIPGGHVHTPVLQFGSGNTTEITDPEFVQNRLDIIAQVRSIIRVTAETTG
ncbi:MULTISPECIES: pyroglutamyl peptidase [unclassified Streptomyces]|uniref:pyroglutamyl peptidase n=1 Tax=unclassified Streptomyces TaxID=2593676 RepID=UPI002DDBD83D|nr:pyroglutamyl peptidase [Streptomyces sp. NBC_01750]WSB02983.1 pyroglutamyl peptidase [Streptomyces sp. NBC_01794]WSD32746.1 pyroglutamyl peptidase [Streptomyces sp. NBC_01750]